MSARKATETSRIPLASPRKSPRVNQNPSPNVNNVKDNSYAEKFKKLQTSGGPSTSPQISISTTPRCPTFNKRKEHTPPIQTSTSCGRQTNVKEKCITERLTSGPEVRAKIVDPQPAKRFSQLNDEAPGDYPAGTKSIINKSQNETKDHIDVLFQNSLSKIQGGISTCDVTSQGDANVQKFKDSWNLAASSKRRSENFDESVSCSEDFIPKTNDLESAEEVFDHLFFTGSRPSTKQDNVPVEKEPIEEVKTYHLDSKGSWTINRQDEKITQRLVEEDQRPELEEKYCPPHIGVSLSQATPKWRSKPVWSSTGDKNRGEYYGALEMSQVLVMEETFGDKFKGKLVVTNKTDQFYGFKILCNSKAQGKYCATPSNNYVKPYDTVSVEIRTLDPIYTNLLAKGDKLVIRAQCFPKEIDTTHPEEMTSVKWPNRGESYRVKIYLLESGSVELLEMIGVSLTPRQMAEYLRSHRDFRCKKTITGEQLNAFTHSLNSYKLEIRKGMSMLNNGASWYNGLLTALIISFAVWSIAPVFLEGEDLGAISVPLYSEPKMDDGVFANFWNFFLGLIPATGWLITQK